MKFTINHDAVRRLGEEVAQKMQNDPNIRARIPAHVQCDVPGCSQRQELPAGILARSSEDMAQAVLAAGWSLDHGRTLCPAHTVHIEPRN